MRRHRRVMPFFQALVMVANMAGCGRRARHDASVIRRNIQLVEFHNSSRYAYLNTIRGIARTLDGRPLAKTRLYLTQLPPATSNHPDSAQTGPVVSRRLSAQECRVLTDSSGRFAWAVPAGWAVDSKGQPPTVWALPQDPASWRWSLALSSSDYSDCTRDDLIQRSTLTCATRWSKVGKKLTLDVTAPDIGAVSLLVRAPNGDPVRGRPVKVTSLSPNENGRGAAFFEGRTDRTGRLSIRWPASLARILVVVPGLGFASTGYFEVRPGQTACPALPPAVPFARVSGSVSPSMRRSGCRVVFEEGLEWAALHSSVGRQCRRPRRWRLALMKLDLTGALASILCGKDRDYR